MGTIHWARARAWGDGNNWCHITRGRAKMERISSQKPLFSVQPFRNI